MRRYKTETDYGYEYAQEEAFHIPIEPVFIDMVKRDPYLWAIPQPELDRMHGKFHKPDPVEFWRGWNAYCNGDGINELEGL